MNLQIPIEAAKNLGPKSAALLRTQGIETLADLHQIDVILLFCRLKNRVPGVSLNLLYAMQAALLDMSIQKLPHEIRADLKLRAAKALKK